MKSGRVVLLNDETRFGGAADRTLACRFGSFSKVSFGKVFGKFFRHAGSPLKDRCILEHNALRIVSFDDRGHSVLPPGRDHSYPNSFIKLTLACFN
jgi:hypothetical protein